MLGIRKMLGKLFRFKHYSKYFENGKIERPQEVPQEQSSSSCLGQCEMIPIRALKFAPLLNNLDDEIGEYFSRFGEVESVSMYRGGTEHWNLVTFKAVNAATAVLTNPIHRITNYDVVVEAADAWLQPDQILNALNDDCLRKIFDYLEYHDVSNAADVCTRFAERAQETFSKRSYCIHVNRNEFGNGMPMVRKFGSVTKRLIITTGIDFEDLPNGTVEKILRKCSAKLEYLTMCCVEKPVLFNRLGCIFRKLKCLRLCHCSIPNLNDLLDICPELKHLENQGGIEEGGCIVRQIQKLEELGCVGTTDSEANRLIMLHPGLKKLTVRFGIFPTINQHLRELMELCVCCPDLREPHQFQQNIRSLGQLSSLQTLTLYFNGMSITPLMEALAENQVPIKQLTLKKGEIDTVAIKNMAQLKQMNTLELDTIDGLTDEHVIELAKQLPNLKKLHLKYTTCEHITLVALKNVLTHATKLSYLGFWLSLSPIVSIDTNDYVEMVKLIQKRSENIKLTIQIYYPRKKVHISKEVLNENCKWLKIM